MSIAIDFQGIPQVGPQGEIVPELPPIVDAFELVRSDIEPPPELIAGLLHMGSKLVLGGSSKAMKTWTLLNVGLSVATGQDWLGLKTVQGTVLYVNFELPAWAIKKRIEKIISARGMKLEAGAFQVWNLRGFAADAKEIIPKMIERAKESGFFLIIVDPIYKCLGGRDENKAGDIAGLMNELERLAVETGAAVAFGAHFSKGNQSEKASLDRIGGSGVYARDPDTILTMTAHREEDAFTVEATLRNFKPIDPFCIRWEFPLMKLAPELMADDLKSRVGGKRAPSDQEFVHLLPEFGYGSKVKECLWTNDQLKAALIQRGFDKNSLAASRDGAEQRGLIAIVRLARNRMLIGVPEAVEEYHRLEARKSKGTAKKTKQAQGGT